jgi:hypothetical protein
LGFTLLGRETPVAVVTGFSIASAQLFVIGLYFS